MELTVMLHLRLVPDCGPFPMSQSAVPGLSADFNSGCREEDEEDGNKDSLHLEALEGGRRREESRYDAMLLLLLADMRPFHFPSAKSSSPGCGREAGNLLRARESRGSWEVGK